MDSSFGSVDNSVSVYIVMAADILTISVPRRHDMASAMLQTMNYQLVAQTP